MKKKISRKRKLIGYVVLAVLIIIIGTIFFVDALLERPVRLGSDPQVRPAPSWITHPQEWQHQHKQDR